MSINQTAANEILPVDAPTDESRGPGIRAYFPIFDSGKKTGCG